MVFIKKVKLARNFRRLLKVVHCFLITSFLYFSEEVSPLLERKDNDTWIFCANRSKTRH
jgi:hypothetical protein